MLRCVGNPATPGSPPSSPNLFHRRPLVSSSSSPSSFTVEPKALRRSLGLLLLYVSTPTSPSRAADIYAHFFDWEDKSSGRWPKPGGDDAEEFDFAFGFDKQLQRKGPMSTKLAAADGLFEKGKFRPSKPPRHLHHPTEDNRSSASKPPRQEVIAERVKERGRSSSTHSTARSRSRRETRSLSPIRGVEDSPKSVASTTTSLTKSSGSKRWRLKDLFLFRSASEGRVTRRGSKDPSRNRSSRKSQSWRREAETGRVRARFSRGYGRGDRRRGRRGGRRDEEEKWVPVTKLGRPMKEGRIRSLEQIYLHSLAVKEHQIVDTILGPQLKDEVMKIMPVQKQNRAGQCTRFKAFVVVGDGNGHVGLGVKCSKEVATATGGPGGRGRRRGGPDGVGGRS